MTKASTPRSKTRRVVFLAAVAGAIAGLVAVILVRGLPGNGQGALAACADTRALVEAVKPLRGGEVANFLPSEQPISVADLVFVDESGAERKMTDYAGETVLLNLWATWCAPCRKEMPALDRLQAELGSEKFSVVTVNIDRRNSERAKKFFKDINIENLAFFADPTMTLFETLKSRGRAIGMPTTMLIDGKGCEIGTMHGAAEWDSEDAVKLIKTALGAAGE